MSGITSAALFLNLCNLCNLRIFHGRVSEELRLYLPQLDLPEFFKRPTRHQKLRARRNNRFFRAPGKASPEILSAVQLTALY